MIKRLSFILLAAIAAVVVVGCAASEPEVNVPVGKPGDPGPKPTGVKAAGGNEGAATQQPVTE